MTSAELGQIMGKHGLNVPDLEFVMGVSRRTVFYWLSGQPIPRPVVLLVKAFDQGLISVDWLANNLDAPPEGDPPPMAS